MPCHRAVMRRLMMANRSHAMTNNELFWIALRHAAECRRMAVIEVRSHIMAMSWASAAREAIADARAARLSDAALTRP